MRAGTGRVATHRGGLAGFEQPRFLHVDAPPETVGPAPAASELIRGQALIGRSLLAVVLVAAGPLLSRDADVVETFGWLVALVWLPGVGLIDLAQRRWGVRHLSLPGLLWDVALFATALALVPRVAVMLDGNPRTRKLLQAAGVEVYVFEGAEICIKGEGGPTCLTRPLLRA